jgi:drug/metabolite transporter (DMT)-like permease
MEKFVYIGCTLSLTVYGQLIVKARSLIHSDVVSNDGKFAYLMTMFTDVGVLSGLAAAVIASVFWTLAIERVGVSFAYPFMALSFVLVPIAASLLFNETLTLLQLAGLSLIVAGVTVNVLAH